MKEAPFVGRDKELELLNRLTKKKMASLVTVQGRRRIGKSRLIEEFAKRSQSIFYRFSGLPPEANFTAQDQRDEFLRSIKEQFNCSSHSMDNWGDLFSLLAKKTASGKVIILLDEISWMADKDPTFLGKLKNAWDIHFNKNPHLILILCGSVSLWIEKNILQSTGYVGRISLALFLKELSLKDCNHLLNAIKTRYSDWEKFLVLSVTGGVPRYIEELQGVESGEEAIRQLCFEPEGFLFREFNTIFTELFAKKSLHYGEIIAALQDGNLSYSDICRILKVQPSSHIIEYLEQLVTSGFLSRDYTWNIAHKKESNLSRYRIRDNYIRFYLKYIQPNKGRIEKGHFREYLLSSLPGWSGLMGIQFENLVLSNRQWILEKMHLRPEDVSLDNPYFQKATAVYPGCQIDYLVQTRFNTLFACEVKFSRQEIAQSIIQEVEAKLKKLRYPKGFACNPVLIHVNGVSDAVIDSGYFAHIISITDALHS